MCFHLCASFACEYWRGCHVTYEHGQVFILHYHDEVRRGEGNITHNLTKDNNITTWRVYLVSTLISTQRVQIPSNIDWNGNYTKGYRKAWDRSLKLQDSTKHGQSPGSWSTNPSHSKMKWISRTVVLQSVKSVRPKVLKWLVEGVVNELFECAGEKTI